MFSTNHSLQQGHGNKKNVVVAAKKDETELLQQKLKEKKEGDETTAIAETMVNVGARDTEF